MTSTDTLLPCPVPWCVSDVLEVVRSPWSRGYGVSCQNCRAQGPDCATEAEAIAAWNRRIPPTPATDEREAVARSAKWAEELRPKIDRVLGHVALVPTLTEHGRDLLAEAIIKNVAATVAAEILAAEANERAALDWLTAHRNVEISHYSPVYADEDDDAVEWRVTRVSGGVNDREWTIIGRGETARAALMDAIEHGAGK